MNRAILLVKNLLPHLLYKVFAKCYYAFSKIKTLSCFLCYGKRRDFLLLCTPTHGNLGDHAIALAEMDFLKNEKLSYFEVTAEDFDGLHKVYSKFSSKKQVVLVHGGGFLGSIWPKEEARFRSIVKTFHDKRIIVLPQTVTFDISSESNIPFFKKSYEIYKLNSNIVFFLRDENSIKFAAEYMPDLKTYYVPDIVLSCAWNMKNASKKENVLFLKRKDIENKISEEDEAKIKKIIDDVYHGSELVIGDTCVDFVIFPFQRKKIVLKKLEEVSKYELVLTDRLHGMLFAFLAKTPCVAMDNKNGKVKATYEWIKESGFVIFVDKLSDFECCVESMKQMNQKSAVVDLDGKFDSLRKELHAEAEVR